MFRTLYSRLAGTLFLLLCLVGVVLIQILGRSSVLYQQEVAQKLNHKLAEHIVHDQPLIRDSEIDQQVLDKLFHNLMVINPSIEIYLLDKSGEILSYSAPEGKVKRSSVDLTLINDFLSGDAVFPLKGGDPRDFNKEKVFSAAEINNEQGLQGYLYIVLGGEQYDDVVEMMGKSYIINSAVIVLAIALIAALFAGLLIFSLQTRRLRMLGGIMGRYSNKAIDSSMPIRFPSRANKYDEVDILGREFNVMADKINDQIAELKKMDGMRREMVANVSHDLRTPLTTIRGYLQTLLLKNDVLTQQEQKQHLEIALRDSEHLGKLVDELFELARLDSYESVVYSEAFSMCELVQDVTQTFELRAKQKEIELEVKLNSDSPLVYGDIAMMQRVLENLLENGLRHTPEGGKISVSVDADSAHVVVEISDTGCGISDDDVGRIFERFYHSSETEQNGKNAGLGLAIVQRILELHGSVIQVQSKLEQGTTFSFQLATSSH